MRKTRDIFKKIRDTKGTFQAKMTTIEDRKGIDLTEAENIKKRWQEYTEKLYKKTLMTQVTMISSVHGLQHARPPSPSPIPTVYSNSCPLSR